MKRMLATVLLAVIAGHAAGEPGIDGGAVRADGASLSVRVGDVVLNVAPPTLRTFETTVKAPADYDASMDLWDAWPGGTKEKPLAVGIGPKRDENNTHVLGGLYRSVLPETVIITSADGSRTFKAGEDYRLKDDWPQIAGIGGRLGAAGQDELKVRLQYATQRLDLVQIDAAGTPSIKAGEVRMVCPQLPAPDAGSRALAGVYVAPWRRDGQFVVAPEDVYPIRPIDPVMPIHADALQRARARLAENGPLTIAFLGDSVTLGAEAGSWWADLWTEKNLSYVSRTIVELRRRHPQATITPVHAAKGATTTKAAPAMFEEKITPAKADVVMIAFGLNDAYGRIDQPPSNPPEQYKEDIRALVRQAKALGAEVILITPMQPNPWMRNKLGERIEAYRNALIALADEERVGCADVYRAWMNQSHAGVPPFSQLHNWNNHPGSEAHKIYADTILRFFDAPATPTTQRAAIAQPTEIPGKWAFGGESDTPPLPELSTILANAKPNDRLYGLYVWPGEYTANRDSIRRVGWRSIRSGGPMTDEAMRAYAEDGVEVLYTLGVNGAIRARLGKEPAAKQELLDEYPTRLEALLSRYGPAGAFFSDNPNLPKNPLTHVEICNEPNFQYVIPPDGRPQNELEADREALYAKLLPSAFSTIKSKWPEVQVVGFGAGGSSAGDLRFIANVHKQNDAVATSYDVLSTHPYVDPAPPEAYAIRSWGRYSIAGSLAMIRRTMGEQVTPRATMAPIWYSEVGWPISKADGGRFETKGERVSPLLQAAYVCRLYALSQRLGVERVHVMFATDTDNFNAGFFTQTGEWRPSALAVCNMIRLMPRPKLVEAISDGVDGVFAYRFESGDPSNASVVMAWTVSGEKQVSLKTPGDEAEVTSMLGETSRVAATNGAIRFTAGPLPTYVR